MHPAPRLPGSLARWERASAALSHWLLYLIMLGMPLSGYLFSAWGGHPVIYFGLFTLPGLVKSDTLQHVAFWAHVAIGQWLTYAVIILHVVATGWHVAVRRDGVLFRMLPEQRLQLTLPREFTIRARRRTAAERSGESRIRDLHAPVRRATSSTLLERAAVI
jgi:hypothetical protein